MNPGLVDSSDIGIDFCFSKCAALVKEIENVNHFMETNLSNTYVVKPEENE